MILIPGMKMPKNCLECPLCWEDEEGMNCCFTNIVCLNIGRQAACPLIELPPHGRLGDLDSLNGIFADELNRYKQIPLDNDDKQETALLNLESAMRIITNAPTIIPADQKER